MLAEAERPRCTILQLGFKDVGGDQHRNSRSPSREDTLVLDTLLIGELTQCSNLGQDADTASGEAEKTVDLPEAISVLLADSWRRYYFRSIVLTTSEATDDVEIAVS